MSSGSMSIIEKSAVGAGDEGRGRSLISSSSSPRSDVMRNGEPRVVENKREKRGSDTTGGGGVTGVGGRASLNMCVLANGKADDDAVRW